MLSIKFFFTLAALVAVSAASAPAKRTAPYGDGWVYAMQNNDFDFDGKNDATKESYTAEYAVLDAKNPKIAGLDVKYCPICGKDVVDPPKCNVSALMTVLGTYDQNTQLACNTLMQAAGTIAARNAYGVYNPHQLLGQGDLTDDMVNILENPCTCWSAIEKKDAESSFYCDFTGSFIIKEWDQCDDQQKLVDWELETDGFNCEEAGFDENNLTYSRDTRAGTGDEHSKASFWGGKIAGLFPLGGTAEDCADKCFNNDKCGAFQFNVLRNYGPVDTHKRGRCTLIPKKLKLSRDGREVDVKEAPPSKYGTARFCVKNGEPRTATSTCGSDSIEEQLDLVGLLNKKPLTPPLTKNVARQLIQKLKDQFRALKKEYRAAKENLRNKGRAAGDGV